MADMIPLSARGERSDMTRELVLLSTKCPETGRGCLHPGAADYLLKDVALN